MWSTHASRQRIGNAGAETIAAPAVSHARPVPQQVHGGEERDRRRGAVARDPVVPDLYAVRIRLDVGERLWWQAGERAEPQGTPYGDADELVARDRVVFDS